jgi:hypothetical protein
MSCNNLLIKLFAKLKNFDQNDKIFLNSREYFLFSRLKEVYRGRIHKNLFS